MPTSQYNYAAVSWVCQRNKDSSYGSAGAGVEKEAPDVIHAIKE
jgi:hypothetical protein